MKKTYQRFGRIMFKLGPGKRKPRRKEKNKNNPTEKVLRLRLRPLYTPLELPDTDTFLPFAPSTDVSHTHSHPPPPSPPPLPASLAPNLTHHLLASH